MWDNFKVQFCVFEKYVKIGGSEVSNSKNICTSKARKPFLLFGFSLTADFVTQ